MAYGQKVNKDKTSICFSKNTRAEVKNAMIRIAGVKVIESYEKYLGLHTMDEAGMITRIPVSQCGSRDKQIWKCTKNGIFTVRSAYHMQIDLEESKKAQCSVNRSDHDKWSVSWSLKLPNAEKVFFRKACHEGLPTKLKLYQRKVVDNPMCPICDQSEETVEHALWSCVAARDVWVYSYKRLQKSKIADQCFKELLFHLFYQMNERELMEIAIIMWKLWKRINALDLIDDTNTIFEDGDHLNKSNPNSYVEDESSFGHDVTNVEFSLTNEHSSTHDLVDARLKLDDDDNDCADL
ncbi:uncharacterized protein LOC121265677 [Juglans microcarpa x Juglans regia]|uniref:uncharacterized protein LOC121265677 n=1 Tax=Juglans microcarpa x Juglans regia TaxID=2249226 RepID=UPI001B7DD671|nr:uncharacterized protein LOC121265677 [Juglans microcarpa x Juglans regia]